MSLILAQKCILINFTSVTSFSFYAQISAEQKIAKSLKFVESVRVIQKVFTFPQFLLNSPPQLKITVV